MSATIDDLLRELQAYFSRQFPSVDDGDGPGSVLLVFDQMGYPLPPTEFTGSGEGAASNVVSHQRAAQLADFLPAVNALDRGWYLARSGSKLSTWYKALVDGAIAADPELLDTVVLRRHAAGEKLAANKLVVATGSIGGAAGTPDASGAIDTYYATAMSPVDWFMPGATCWTSFKTEAPEEPAPSDHSGSHGGSGVSSGPTFPPDRPNWIVHGDVPLRTIDMERVQENQSLATFVTDAVRAQTVDLVDRVATPIGSSVVTPADVSVSAFDPEMLAALDPTIYVPADETQPVSPSIVERLTTPFTPVFAPEEEPAFTPSIAEQLAAPAASLRVRSEEAEGWRSTVADQLRVRDGFTAVHSEEEPGWRPSIAQLIAASNFDPIVIIDATSEHRPSSDSFSASFQYCLVRFSRPWWDEVFLYTEGWKLQGYDPGSLSSGSVNAPKDPITLITIGMIVIKDLVLKASWTDDDLQELESALNLGPFSLAGARLPTSRNGSLQRPGPQAIAWLVQVPPVLPPARD
jgi:2-oxoglutarate dehydrogenase E2 component (dihydrolipoamide succinyltransferase)